MLAYLVLIRDLQDIPHVIFYALIEVSASESGELIGRPQPTGSSLQPTTEPVINRISVSASNRSLSGATSEASEVEPRLATHESLAKKEIDQRGSRIAIPRRNPSGRAKKKTSGSLLDAPWKEFLCARPRLKIWKEGCFISFYFTAILIPARPSNIARRCETLAESASRRDQASNCTRAARRLRSFAGSFARLGSLREAPLSLPTNHL